MPYEVKKRGGQYCVVKEGGGREFGCHETPDEAYAQIAAIEASEGKGISVLDTMKALSVAAGPLLEGRVHEVFTVIADRLFQAGVLNREERIALSGGIGKSLAKLSGIITDLGLDNRKVPSEVLLNMAVRSVSGQGISDHWVHNTMVSSGGEIKDLTDKGQVGGYLVVFSPKGVEKDWMGDYFTKSTDYRWSGKEGRLAIYHHGLDEILGKRAMGAEWKLCKTDDVGLWVESQLDMRKRYEKAVYGLVKQKALGLSSGTAAHLIEKETDGHIRLWAIVEGSYTPTPMERRTMVMPLSEIRAVQPFRALMELQQRKGHNPGIERSVKGDAGSGTRQIVLADPIELVHMFMESRR